MFHIFSDFSVKVVTVEDGAQQVFRGHEAPVRSVALDPDNHFLVRTLSFLRLRILKHGVNTGVVELLSKYILLTL